MRAATLVLLLSGVALGCSDSALQPSESETNLSSDGRASNRELRVLTRNLYVGTDVDAVIAALRSDDPGDDFAALMASIETLRRTDFPARAAAIADEIAKAKPHAVGLQEVSRIDLTLPGV